MQFDTVVVQQQVAVMAFGFDEPDWGVERRGAVLVAAGQDGDRGSGGVRGAAGEAGQQGPYPDLSQRGEQPGAAGRPQGAAGADEHAGGDPKFGDVGGGQVPAAAAASAQVGGLDGLG